MYIVAMKTKFAKQDQENLAMKIQVWEKQHPSDKIFFRGYGNFIEESNQEYDEADTENQRDFSDEVRSNFKFNIQIFFTKKLISQNLKREVYTESEPKIPYFPHCLVQHRI